MDSRVKHERKTENPERVRRSPFRRILSLLLVLIAVLGVVLAAVYFDMNSFESVRRLFTYSAEQRSGQTVLYNYTADRSNTFALFGEHLLVASQTRIDLLDEDGTAIYSRTVQMDTPAIEVGTACAVVYDVGGSALYRIDTRGRETDMTIEDGEALISVRVGVGDFITVTSTKSRYKASVSVYNAATECVYTLDSANRYVVDANVLPGGRTLAALTLGQEDNVFSSTLLLSPLDGASDGITAPVGDGVALRLECVGDAIGVLMQEEMVFFSADGTLRSRYGFGNSQISSYTCGDFATLVFKSASVSAESTIVTLSFEGVVLSRLDTTDEVRNISSAGRYLSVLSGRDLRIYTSDLATYASAAEADYARSAIMRTDGTALLLGASSARLFVP